MGRSPFAITGPTKPSWTHLYPCLRLTRDSEWQSKTTPPPVWGEKMMSGELIAILAVGVALAGLILSSTRGLRSEIAQLRGEFAQLRGEFAELRAEVAQLRERMAHLEGLLDGLREAISGRRAVG